MSAEAERWREALEPLPGISPRIPDYVREAGDALLAALEAAEVEKAHLTKVATEYQSRIAELEAGLRTICAPWEPSIGPADSGPWINVYRAAGGGYVGLQAIARDLLAVRAAGGER